MQIGYIIGRILILFVFGDGVAQAHGSMAVVSQSFRLISLHGCLFNRANVHTNDSLSIQHQVKTLTFVGTSEGFNLFTKLILEHQRNPFVQSSAFHSSHTSVVHQSAILVTWQNHRHITGNHAYTRLRTHITRLLAGEEQMPCSCTHQIS